MTQRLMRRRQPGFSMVEIIVVMGVIGIMCSIIFPVLAEARQKARVTQCGSQLRQIGQAMVMYDTDHNRDMENYPDRLTHLHALGYVQNDRVFVCAADPTKARGPKLKPGNPAQDYSWWAERTDRADAEDTTGLPRKNSSYVYEFNTRVCQTYTYDPATGDQAWVGDNWCSQVMIEWLPWDEDLGSFVYEPGNQSLENEDFIVPARPFSMDRDRDRRITYQEAMLWQIDNADTYVTGHSDHGDPGIPNLRTRPPMELIDSFQAAPQRNYSRNWRPTVRCFWHCNSNEIDMETEDVLNLSLDGNTFYSQAFWEKTAWNQGRSNTDGSSDGVDMEEEDVDFDAD